MYLGLDRPAACKQKTKQFALPFTPDRKNYRLPENDLSKFYHNRISAQKKKELGEWRVLKRYFGPPQGTLKSRSFSRSLPKTDFFHSSYAQRRLAKYKESLKVLPKNRSMGIIQRAPNRSVGPVTFETLGRMEFCDVTGEDSLFEFLQLVEPCERVLKLPEKLLDRRLRTNHQYKNC